MRYQIVKSPHDIDLRDPWKLKYHNTTPYPRVRYQGKNYSLISEWTRNYTSCEKYAGVFLQIAGVTATVAAIVFFSYMPITASIVILSSYAVLKWNPYGNDLYETRKFIMPEDSTALDHYSSAAKKCQNESEVLKRYHTEKGDKPASINENSGLSSNGYHHDLIRLDFDLFDEELLAKETQIFRVKKSEPEDITFKKALEELVDYINKRLSDNPNGCVISLPLDDDSDFKQLYFIRLKDNSESVLIKNESQTWLYHMIELLREHQYICQCSEYTRKAVRILI